MININNSKINLLFYIVIIATLLFSTICATVYIPKANINYDEANYVYQSYRFYKAIKYLKFSDFWNITLEPQHYPPFQVWLIGFMLVPFKYTPILARQVCLIWFIFSSILIFLIAKETDNIYGSVIGLIASLFFITSPLVLYHASILLKEMMGACLTLVIFYLYLIARKSKEIKYYIYASIFLAILALTKYNYTVILLPILGIEIIGQLIFQKKRLAIIVDCIFLFAPSVLILFFWFKTSNKLNDLLFVVFTNSMPPPQITATTKTLDWILFYPRSIFLMYSPSFVLGIIYLISLVFPIYYIKNLFIRLCWLAISMNLFFATFVVKNNLQERFILTTIPFLFITSSFTVVKLWQKLFRIRDKKVFFVPFIMLIIIGGIRLVYDLLQINSLVYKIGSYTSKSALFYQTDYVDAKNWFNYNTNDWAKNVPKSLQEKQSDIIDFIVSTIDLSRPYQIIGQCNEFPPAYILYALMYATDNRNYATLPYSSYIVTIEILPDSKWYTHDYLYSHIPYINYLGGTDWQKKDPNLIVIKKKTFMDLGVNVIAYARK
jgi:hypothetical protein